jgi:hypothetical protein
VGPEGGGAAVWAREAERARSEAEAMRRELAQRAHDLRLALDGREAAAEATRAAAKERDRLAAELSEHRVRLDALALETARREAELQTSAWRIAELEQRVAMTERAAPAPEAFPTEPPSPAALSVEPSSDVPSHVTEKLVLAEDRLSRAEDELEVLRTALAQEHAARVQAESGEALARARNEIQRQATLIEKLSIELEAKDRSYLGPPA